ncbi:MAG TPA: class I SAM-dependent methyltransferase, partial [Methanomicrobiales archaeon]|nr:class I SAM-dependent methyltransferase [Methanomicrobiales archaeon]
MLEETCRTIEAENPIHNQEIFGEFGLLSDHPWQAVANSPLTTYYGCLYRIIEREKPRKILEIGTAFGLSSATMLRASGNPELFISLDLGIIADQTGFSQNNIMYTRTRIHSWCCRQGIPIERVRFYKANSQPEGIGDNEDSGSEILRWHRIPDLLRLLQAHEFDVIFVDGKHTGDGLLNDLLTFWPFLKEGGLLICDDLHEEEKYRGVFPWAGQTLASYNRFLHDRNSDIADSFIWNYPRVPPGDFRGIRPFGLLRKRERVIGPSPPEFGIFDTPAALAINRARQDHLASLGLDLVGKSVLEVGSGVGWHTGFFEKLGCRVFSTDARPENVKEHVRRFPHRAKQVAVADLNLPGSHDRFGQFDVVYCYGTLYHLRDPALAIRELSAHCSGTFLLETCVFPYDNGEINPQKEDAVWKNQSYDGTGCRPGRDWILRELKRHYPFVSVTCGQPRHPEFPLHWPVGKVEHENVRAVFVASRQTIALPTLSTELVDDQVPIEEILPERQVAAPIPSGHAHPARKRPAPAHPALRSPLFLSIFNREGAGLMDSLEKNFYGSFTEDTLVFRRGEAFLFSPTDGKDHFVTPFFEPIPVKPGKDYLIRVTLLFHRDGIPGKNCVVHLQDSQFNQLSSDFDFSSPREEAGNLCGVTQTVNLGGTRQKFRIIITTTDGRPTFIPVSLR